MKQRQQPSLCYFCGDPATSKDHVPPRSFFPEAKDLPPGSPDLRSSLITVPSCNIHNQHFSKDDEIAAYTILMHHDSNNSATQQFSTKAMRAFLRRPAILKRILAKSKRVLVREPGGILLKPTLAFRIDVPLIERVMEKIARGLYFHDFNTQWQSDFLLASHGILMNDSLAPDGPLAKHTALLELYMEQQPINGENPLIFNYKWLLNGGTHILRMCFYAGFIYYALPRPMKAAP